MKDVDGEIVYKIGNGLYINVTNKCSAACSFCIRNNTVGIEGHHLWLKEEPDAADIIKAIEDAVIQNDGHNFSEYVFCGYGEPLYRLDSVVNVAKWLKSRGAATRLNTNGHGNLINGRNVAPDLSGLIDIVSISLNAHTPWKYQEICRTIYGPDAFGAVLYFADRCIASGIRVVLSVVDIPEIDIDKCKEIAQELGAELRVRSVIED